MAQGQPGREEDQVLERIVGDWLFDIGREWQFFIVRTNFYSETGPVTK
jgi:hypothetical protein